MSLLLREAVNQLNPKLARKAGSWVRDEPTQADIEHIFKEGSEVSRFDPQGRRKQMVDDLQAGKAKLMCRRLTTGAKVLAIVHPELEGSIPWELFARIFSVFPRAPWRVVLFANPTPRVFPEPPHQPSPLNVNGGYAIPGKPDSIVIYRLEECHRVLLHELLHAAGTDNMINDESTRETLTEAWAEVFLVAILASGSWRKAKALWQAQAQWIVDQEVQLRSLHNVNDPSSYAYRYTVGRRTVLEGWGFVFPPPSGRRVESLRFTV